MSIDQILNEAQEQIAMLHMPNEAVGYARAEWVVNQLEQLKLPTAIASTNDKSALPTAADFLRAGIGHMQDRAVHYDAPQGERSMGKTVAMFNIATGKNLSEADGWLLMTLLKQVRSLQGKYKADNHEDEASYAGLRGEAAAREHAKNTLAVA